MVTKDGYDYDRFLSDSDDYPTYADGITPNQNKAKADEVFGLDNYKIPPYDNGTMKTENTNDDSSQCPDVKIKQNDDDWNYKEAYQKSSCVDHKGSTIKTTENIKIALINVLEMAKEYSTNNLVDSDKIIGDESIRLVQEFLGQIEDANAMLAKADNK
tara:strand:+ start:480 stop:953 length:474 start_codon:yes stop_codon:yes gene_type:complete